MTEVIVSKFKKTLFFCQRYRPGTINEGNNLRRKREEQFTCIREGKKKAKGMVIEIKNFVEREGKGAVPIVVELMVR